MGFYHQPRIVTDGLFLYYDVANYESYSNDSSTILYDISGNGRDASIYGAPEYVSDYRGGLFFDTSTKYAYLPDEFDTYSEDALFSIYMNCRILTGNWGCVFSNNDDINNIRIGMYTSLSVPYIYVRSGSATKSTGPFSTSSSYKDVVYSISYRVNNITEAGYLDVFGSNNAYLPNPLSFRYTESFGFGENNEFDSNLIGGDRYGGSQHDFYLYTFAAYNRVLTDVEMLQNYHALRGRFENL